MRPPPLIMYDHIRWTLAPLVLFLLFPSRATAQRDASQLLQYRLRDTTVIDGIACAPTGRARAATYPNGRFESCPLAHDSVIAGHALPAGTWVYVTEERVLRRAWLKRDTRLDGHLCRGDGYDAWSVEFHPNGALRMCFLRGDAVIEGVPCRGASFWAEVTGGASTGFHENGQLAACGLAKDYVRDGFSFRARQRIRFDSRGSIAAPATT